MPTPLPQGARGNSAPRTCKGRRHANAGTGYVFPRGTFRANGGDGEIHILSPYSRGEIRILSPHSKQKTRPLERAPGAAVRCDEIRMPFDQTRPRKTRGVHQRFAFSGRKPLMFQESAFHENRAFRGLEIGFSRPLCEAVERTRFGIRGTGYLFPNLSGIDADSRDRGIGILSP
jgi:hypothetical protein